MGCRGLRFRLLAAGVGSWLLVAPCPAADAPPSDAQAPRKRLDFGLYGRPYGPAQQELPPSLRFESWLEVEGAPLRTLDETMASWWRHFDVPEPAVYGHGYNLRPDAQPNAVNLVPLFQKVYEKFKKRK